MPLYCKIVTEAHSMLWLFWWISIIPFLSLCLVVWNLGLLWELKQESKKKDSTTKKQLQERKRILTKGIAYASYFAEYVSVIFLAGLFGKKAFWNNILWLRIYLVGFATSHS